MRKFCCYKDDKVLAFTLHKQHLNTNKKKITKSNRELDKVHGEEFYCKEIQIANTSMES